MTIDRLKQDVKRLMDDLAEISSQKRTLELQYDHIVASLATLREVCPHPIQQKIMHPETGDECGVCHMDWAHIAE